MVWRSACGLITSPQSCATVTCASRAGRSCDRPPRPPHRHGRAARSAKAMPRPLPEIPPRRGRGVQAGLLANAFTTAAWRGLGVLTGTRPILARRGGDLVDDFSEPKWNPAQPDRAGRGAQRRAVFTRAGSSPTRAACLSSRGLGRHAENLVPLRLDCRSTARAGCRPGRIRWSRCAGARTP